MEKRPDEYQRLKKVYQVILVATVVCTMVLLWEYWLCAKRHGDIPPEDIDQEFYGEYDDPINVDTTFISVEGKSPYRVVFGTFDSLDIIEGDIIIRDRNLQKELQTLGNVALGKTWPGGVIPYRIDSNVPKHIRDNIQFAIEHWRENTSITFTQEIGNRPDYIVFAKGQSATIGSSMVGRVGTKQYIYLGRKTSAAVAIHEIGHALGLWHEQSRPDRDKYVKIVTQNIAPRNLHNFQYNGDAYGDYDFNSRMHYSPFAFSINGKATIETLDASNVIQNNGRLSKGDIATIAEMYKQPPI